MADYLCLIVPVLFFLKEYLMVKGGYFVTAVNTGHLCVMDIFPFNKLEEFEFQLALAEFSIGHAKIGFKSLDELHINPFTLNNINTDKLIDENNDPDLNFFNKTVNEDKCFLDNELNKLIQD